MLYSVVTAALGILYGLMLLWAYRIGLKDGLQVKDTGKIEPMEPEEKAPAKQDERFDRILDNIDAYNGTPSGQKEV